MMRVGYICCDYLFFPSMEQGFSDFWIWSHRAQCHNQIQQIKEEVLAEMKQYSIKYMNTFVYELGCF